MTELDDAMWAVDSWAREQCAACREVRWAIAAQDAPGDAGPHTCHEVKALAKRLAVAAIDSKWMMSGIDAVKARLDRRWPDKEDTMTIPASDSEVRSS